MDCDVMTSNAPKPSWRKPVGALAIVSMIAGWAVLVSSVMDWLTHLPVWLMLIIYAIAGVIWIIPARHILVWMETGRSPWENKTPRE